VAISLGQIDLEALKNYLKIVQGFRTVNDPSGDTDHVAGIPSEFIAAIAEVEDPAIQEQLGRAIVDGALNIVRIEDGSVVKVSGNDVLTVEEGTELKETAIEAAKNTANDMRALKNEMYHLKRDMIRTGSLAYDPVYDGYIDPFLNGLDVYSTEPLEIDSIDGSNSIAIAAGNIESYDVGQYAAILSKNNVLEVEKVTERTGGSLTLGDGMFIFNAPPDTISKSYGLYDKGRFVFANNEDSLTSLNNEVNMIYKDGIDRLKVAELNEAAGVLGFASTIVVPAELDENYLTSVSLSLRKTGNPGNCYVELYDYNDANLYGDPVAMSNYLNSGKATDSWGTYKFTFEKDVLLEKGHIYLLVIKAVGTSKLNMWYVGGFAEQCNYGIHQDTYTYTVDSKYKKEGPDVLNNQVYDMFIGLHTTETKQLNLNYSKQGLYTGSFDLENSSASRVRVSFNPRCGKTFYKVYVKGLTSDKVLVEGKLAQELEYNHVVWVNGECSYNEVVYDFTFPQIVDHVEFQIIYDRPELVEKEYEALFAVVVSTDNALLKGDNN
jgi:hypothetical protein